MPEPAGGKRYTIGRDKDCDVAIADESVSRVHAELIILDGGKYLLSDKASSNGTSIIDGGQPHRITQAQVSLHDRVQFGSVVLSVGDLVEVIQSKSAKSHPVAISANTPVPLGTVMKGGLGSLQSIVAGRWREATLIILVLTAAVLLLVGDMQSQSFKFLIGILGSLIASLTFNVLQRLWEKK